MSEEELFNDVLRANQAGLACAVHAIGDAACHVVLNAYERAGQRTGRLTLRNRMEHAQLVHPDDIDRFARLSVIASMQPLHATSDMVIAERHWGSRCADRLCLEAPCAGRGARLAFGSDCPVEVPDPLAGIHAAVTRRRADGSPGPEGWRPAERLSVEQAVHGYTLGAAYAAGQEDVLGSIAPGKLADLTVTEQDIFAIPPQEILAAQVSATMVGGQFVYRSF